MKTTHFNSDKTSATHRVATIGELFGDPARAAILVALLDGRALTAGELALAGNISAQSASGHLAKLTAGGLLVVRSQGRHRYYRIATHKVAEMLEGIMAVVADGPPRHRPASKTDDAMRLDMSVALSVSTPALPLGFGTFAPLSRSGRPGRLPGALRRPHPADLAPSRR